MKYKVIDIKDNDESKELIKYNIILINFYATWCGPCKIIIPTMDLLANKLKDTVGILKVDTDINQELIMKYEVTMLPSVLLLKNGKNIERFLGVNTYNFYLNKIKEII